MRSPIAIKFCLRNDISAAETYRMLQKAFGDESISQKNVYKWYRDFKEAENVSMICNAPNDHRIQLMTKTSTKSRKWCLETIREVGMVEISFGSMQTISTDHLGLRRVKSRLVPTNK